MSDAPAPSWPRAVLLDFDGTLADSFAAITASANHVAAEYGVAPFDEAHVRGLVGYGLEHFLGTLFPDHDVARSVELYRADHLTTAHEQTRLLPGVWDTLTELHRRGVRMAVCSNKSVRFTKALCESLKIAPFFGAILGPEDVPEPKPSPDMLDEAMRRLGVTKEETLYVGDMTVDIETAKAAGVPVWVLPTGAQDEAALREARPDRILANFGELL